MTQRASALLLSLLFASPPARMAEPPAAGSRLSFRSCPIVRDTSTVPCWLSEYDGDLYYLTIQSDVSAEVQPPMLGHQVLVEGVVSARPEICGGVVLEQVRLSVMPELDANCNTMLPADERYVIDFNPRPPGPSGGRLAFDPVPVTGQTEAPQAELPLSIDVYFDFDRAVSFRHPGMLVEILELANEMQASRLLITGVRGAHRLSDGSLLQEAPGISRRRAEEIAALLQGAGLEMKTEIAWQEGSADADGIDDWQSRRVTVELLP